MPNLTKMKGKPF